MVEFSWVPVPALFSRRHWGGSLHWKLPGDLQQQDRGQSQPRAAEGVVPNGSELDVPNLIYYALSSAEIALCLIGKRKEIFVAGN